MGEDGKRLWGTVVPILYAQRVLTKADVPALEQMCVMYDQHSKFNKSGVPIPSAERNALRLYFNEFGMTSSSRTRIHPAGNGQKENPFRNNGNRAKRD